MRRHIFFYAALLEVIILAPLFIWNPFLCMSDEEEFATIAFADEARASKLLFGSCLCVITASLAPLADALLDLWRYFSGLKSPERSPYTWNVDGKDSAIYLAERLSVIVVFDMMAILLLEVTRSDSNYDATVIYSVIRGGYLTCYSLLSGIYLSILRTSAGAVVTETVASWVFAICFCTGITFYWGCSPIATNCAFAVELITKVFLFALVCRDYFFDTDEDIRKSYLKAVSLTYATFYVAYFAFVTILLANFRSSFVRFPITRFLAAVYMSMTLTYLASPKWREELLQTVHLRKTMHDVEASRFFQLAAERRAAAMKVTSPEVSLNDSISKVEASGGGGDYCDSTLSLVSITRCTEASDGGDGGGGGNE
jgi:hypothetical protein